MTIERTGSTPDCSSDFRQTAEEVASSAGISNVRAKRALLANMRHELRTPINAIIGYSEILIEEATNLTNPSFLHDLQSISNAGHKLLDLLDMVLDQSKIESSGVDVTSSAFAAHVRHQLRTPLNTVVGYSEMLLESAEDLVEGTAADLRKIHVAAMRMLDLLDDIIRLSKIEAGKTGYELEDSSALPIVRDVVSTIQALVADANRSVDIAPGSLLIVDDNEMNRDVLRRQLERQGYAIGVAKDGRQALSLLSVETFDLVLLDILMPEMNGYDLLRHMKAHDIWRHIPVIMISAMGEVDSVVRCIEEGADDYLTKPFNPVLLKARIGACLEKKRLRDREQAHFKELSAEREKSERLLLNVLPAPIAERLKHGEAPIADAFGEATVMFADLVGFTRLAATLPASDVVELLNDIFTEFDALAIRHGVEKIKTIGDAYMIVAGLPTPREDHVDAAVAMALDMLSAISRIRSQRGNDLSIRVGLNSGPVVAGVIGRNKFAYDLWGDTVNTASRIESHGSADCLAVPESVYNRLKGKYSFEDRGVVKIKDKGPMRIYLLREQVASGRHLPSTNAYDHLKAGVPD